MDKSDKIQSLETKSSELSNEQLLVQGQLDRERLMLITNNLIETITSPQVVEKMREFRKGVNSETEFQAAGEFLSRESLIKAGADIPDDFRITSRIFEDKVSGMRVELHSPDAGSDAVKARGSWSGCAGGGAWTVCGCAGGGYAERSAISSEEQN